MDCFENLNFQFVHQLHHHLHNRRDLDDHHELPAHQVNLVNEKQLNCLESVNRSVLKQAQTLSKQVLIRLKILTVKILFIFFWQNLTNIVSGPGLVQLGGQI